MIAALIAQAVLLAVGATGARLRGETFERKGAALFGAIWLAVLILHLLGAAPAGPWPSLVDLGLLIGLFNLTWRSPRPWPIYACGLALLALAADIAGWVGSPADQVLAPGLAASFRTAAVFTFAAGAWIRPRAE
jgi:hypothetical protein